MAIYHLRATMISRSAGRSATAAAAYRSATHIEDHRTGLAQGRKGVARLLRDLAQRDGLAAGAGVSQKSVVPVYGKPMIEHVIAALAMSGSSLIVVANSLRLARGGK